MEEHIYICAIKYVLDTEEHVAINVDGGLMMRLFRLLKAPMLLTVASWCMERDRVDAESCRRLMRFTRMIFMYRPDAVLLAHDLFFLRSADMSTMRPVFLYLIKLDHFKAEANVLIRRLKHAYADENLSHIFFLDAIQLIQEHIDIDKELVVPPLPLDVELTRSLGDLRAAVTSDRSKCKRDGETPYELMSLNDIDPLSLKAVGDIPTPLVFEVDGYHFEIIAFANYVRLRLDHVLAPSRAFHPTYFPKHPFTDDHLRKDTIISCRVMLAHLWRRYILHDL